MSTDQVYVLFLKVEFDDLKFDYIFYLTKFNEVKDIIIDYIRTWPDLFDSHLKAYLYICDIYYLHSFKDPQDLSKKIKIPYHKIVKSCDLMKYKHNLIDNEIPIINYEFSYNQINFNDEILSYGINIFNHI